jgi:membrane protease YdiL (CAAX protease family)
MAEAAPGSQLQQAFSRSVASVGLAAIVLGPLIEEVMFRGWFSGTWRSVDGSALFCALVFGIIHLVDGLFSVSASILQLALDLIGLIGFALLSPIDSGKRLPFFERAFPNFNWVQGLVFGALHFQNVTTNSALLVVLSTVPIVICAWLWGYARIYLGLGSAVLLHAAYNVPAVAGMLAFAMLQGS